VCRCRRHARAAALHDESGRGIPALTAQGAAHGPGRPQVGPRILGSRHDCPGCHVGGCSWLIALPTRCFDASARIKARRRQESASSACEQLLS
jgi:hypothetical protein